MEVVYLILPPTEMAADRSLDINNIWYTKADKGSYLYTFNIIILGLGHYNVRRE